MAERSSPSPPPLARSQPTEPTDSPFTRALIANLSGAGLEVGTAFKRVVRDVRKETQGKQQPQILSSLSLEFYFGPEMIVPHTNATLPAIQAPAVDPAALGAEADFKKALRIGTPRIWHFFVEKHRTGEYAQLARQTLAQIEPAAVRNQSHLPLSVEARLLPDKQQRKNVQLALAAKGFASGVADGVFGGQTREAIKRFQSTNRQPASGFITELTAAALGIKVNDRAEGIYSSTTARIYDIDDLTGLETDERVLAAIKCLGHEPSVYGAFGGHLYVVARTGSTRAPYAETVAKNCGTYLASITSDAENAFIASLFNADPGFFDMGYYAPDNISYKIGPWIGLVQDPQGKEPKGGWHWDSGEAMTYTKWVPGAPYEFKPGADSAMYFTQRDGRQDMRSTYLNTWQDMGLINMSPSLVLEFE